MHIEVNLNKIMHFVPVATKHYIHLLKFNYKKKKSVGISVCKGIKGPLRISLEK